MLPARYDDDNDDKTHCFQTNAEKNYLHQTWWLNLLVRLFVRLLALFLRNFNPNKVSDHSRG